jgi:hypothetical protein
MPTLKAEDFAASGQRVNIVASPLEVKAVRTQYTRCERKTAAWSNLYASIASVNSE